MAFTSPYGVLDNAHPVNWDSPLTQGLATWHHFGLYQHYGATTGRRTEGLTRRPNGSAQGTNGVTPFQFAGTSNPGIPGAIRFNAGAIGPALPFSGNVDDLFTNPSAATILFVSRHRDTTNRDSNAFGVLSDGASQINRINCSLPFSNGSIFFDFGGATDGASRVSFAYTKDTAWHWWAFVVGNGQGMRIYRDGILLASNSATPSRSVSSGTTFYIGRNQFTGSDSFDVSEFVGFNRGLSHSEVRDWMRQAQAGHPDTLNWSRPHKRLVSVGATSPPPPPSAPAIRRAVEPPAIDSFWHQYLEAESHPLAPVLYLPVPPAPPPPPVPDIRQPVPIPDDATVYADFLGGHFGSLSQIIPSPLPTLPPVPLPQSGTAGKALIPTDALASPSTREAIDRIREPLNSLMSDGRLVRFDVANRKWTLTTGFTASRAPTATDDISTGALPGMVWINTDGNAAYICVTNAAGAAVWLKLSTE